MARPQRSDARRNHERLLSAATQSLEERGAEASLEDIARRAGVGIGTLYRHFPTRDALLEAVFRRNVDQLCAGGRQLLETLPPEEALATWMRRLVEYVAAKKGLATHLKTVLAADSDLFVSTHERIGATIRSLVGAAVAAGAIRADVDPEDLLRALFGVCLMADDSGSQERARRISGLLMDGLRFRPPAPPGSAPAPAVLLGSPRGARRRAGS
ncbi:MAG TPA: helix-turn-helix domain-containing protein [Acidimicrobiales bacterium]|nr:helix-turn-helix domain-containing protein [Acidimicrobiales bacterium]